MKIAEFIPMTKTHGPGLRAVIQVQGCRMGCPGCIAPHTWDYNGGWEVEPRALADAILKLPVDGVTFTGGEPFDQAAELFTVAAMLRFARPSLTYIAFTGYQIGALQASYRYGVRDLLSQLDMVIDGPYVARLDNGMGLRGSTNQQIIHLTDRIKCLGLDFEQCKRLVEWHKHGQGIVIVGIPDKEQARIEEQFFSSSEKGVSET